MKKSIKRILTILLIALIGIQFIRIDKSNPDADPANDFITMEAPPDEIAGLLKTACYDCHSHHTVYPWYTNIAPFSFWIKDHVDHARSHLNFSEWDSYDRGRKHHKMEECYEEVEAGQMPLPSYLWMHREARMSEQQIGAMVSWFKAQLPKYE